MLTPLVFPRHIHLHRLNRPRRRPTLPRPPNRLRRLVPVALQSPTSHRSRAPVATHSRGVPLPLAPVAYLLAELFDEVTWLTPSRPRSSSTSEKPFLPTVSELIPISVYHE